MIAKPGKVLWEPAGWYFTIWIKGMMLRSHEHYTTPATAKQTMRTYVKTINL